MHRHWPWCQAASDWWGDALVSLCAASQRCGPSLVHSLQTRGWPSFSPSLLLHLYPLSCDCSATPSLSKAHGKLPFSNVFATLRRQDSICTQPQDIGIATIPTLQMRKEKCMEVKEYAQDYAAALVKRLGLQPTHVRLTPKPLLCPLHNVSSRLIFLKIAFMQKSLHLVLHGPWGFSPNYSAQHLLFGFQPSDPTFPFNPASELNLFAVSWTCLCIPASLPLHKFFFPTCSILSALSLCILSLTSFHQSSRPRQDSTFSFKSALVTWRHISKLWQHFFLVCPDHFIEISWNWVKVGWILEVHHVRSFWTYDVSDL